MPRVSRPPQRSRTRSRKNLPKRLGSPSVLQRRPRGGGVSRPPVLSTPCVKEREPEIPLPSSEPEAEGKIRIFSVGTKSGTWMLRRKFKLVACLPTFKRSPNFKPLHPFGLLSHGLLITAKEIIGRRHE
uniref:Uncharacterized protein n=1 Tax=Cacopsylla melanoneura TaxID=428564 RepID=A0A8D9FHX1_9HEMI